MWSLTVSTSPMPHSGGVRHSVPDFGLGPGVRALQVAAPAFDASALEIFGALAAGAVLCLASEEARLSGPLRLRLAFAAPVLLNRYRRRYHASADGHLRVTVDWALTHEYASDVSFSLTSPDGTTVVLGRPATSTTLSGSFGPLETALIADLGTRIRAYEDLMAAMEVRKSAAELRAIFDDDAKQPRWIRTVRRFGYAFIGEARDETSSPHGAHRDVR